MRIAIPVWEDRVSPVLDTASKLLVIERDDQGDIWRNEIHLREQGLSQRASRIEKAGIDILICGAVSSPFSQILIASGINLISGISGCVEDVLRAYMRGCLTQPKFLMPGCRRMRFGHRLCEGDTENPLVNEERKKKNRIKSTRGGWKHYGNGKPMFKFDGS